MKSTYLLLLVLLSIANGALWARIVFLEEDNFSAYFFDVGQGDAQMLSLKSGASILIDGGRGDKILPHLDKIFRWKDRYIDIVFLSHPQKDHFGGLLRVIERYRVGAFILSMHNPKNREFIALIDGLEKRKIPIVVLRNGDDVGQGDVRIDVLSPPRELKNVKNINETSLVLRVTLKDASLLLTGDISKKIERQILKRTEHINAQILKVPHHGSKYSSSNEFLARVAPAVSVIGVGKNSYGHPTEEAMQRILNVGSEIFRTDKHGTVKIVVKDGVAKIFTHALR